MATTDIPIMTLELPTYRSPSEAYSLLLRVMRSCPWNECGFCNMYRAEPVQGNEYRRSVAEVKNDINTLRTLADMAEEASRNMGYDGRMNDKVHGYLLSKGVNPFHFGWLLEYGSEPESAFLADADALLVKTNDLVEMVRYLQEQFPSIKTITSYAMARTIVRKKPDDLEAIRYAGLSRLNVGLESGDDEVLEYIQKGATSQEMIRAGEMARESAYDLSLFVMPGVGGKRFSEQHARNTARVLNEIDPDYARMRPLHLVPGTPLKEMYDRGEFQPLSRREMLEEIMTMVDPLTITGRLCFDHAMNPTYTEDERDFIFRLDYEGYQMPNEKEIVLAEAENALWVMK